MPSQVVWSGEVTKCDICNTPITKDFVDGRTKMGPWACMCLNCHSKNGVGLGTGKGQHYQKNWVGDFVKVGG